jgi:glycosyltransferase involved in cell wall biosynthesis
MKLVVVCQYFYPEQFKVNDICFELVKRGYDVTVLTGLPNYPSGIIPKDYRWFKRRHEDINGVRVIRSSLVARGQGKLRLVLNYLSFAVCASVKALFLKKDFDLILVYQLSPVTMALPALLLKKLTGKPVLLYCQDLWPESIVAAGLKTEGFIYMTLLELSRYIYKRADKLAISSKLFAKYFKEVIGINGDIQYLPVYAESLFENIKKKCTETNIINLVFAGNIGEMQSVETIIHAANELKDVDMLKWHIVGDGSNRAICEIMVKELGLSNVVFYGQRPIDAMPEFYSMADAFLVTLKANKEISYTLPNKVQSYMAAGKPIFGAIDGETRLVIEEAGAGLCCNAEDYIALAEIIRGFAFNTEKHNVMGENALKYYQEHFGKKKFMKSLIKFLTVDNRV